MLNLTNIDQTASSERSNNLEEIEHFEQLLFQHFQTKFLVDPLLTRPLVSFQANKNRSVYRWYKYKEAFSASLLEYLFQRYGITQGNILDPFAGCGTTLFVASQGGMNADGIELLPIGQQIINAKQILHSQLTSEDFARLQTWSNSQIWQEFTATLTLPELRITKGAYPPSTKDTIEKYLTACQTENVRVKTVLNFILLCILESISYTRKDGQYLRWDYRSGRGMGKKQFDKGEILDFNHAILDKSREILEDLTPSTQQLELFPRENHQGKIILYPGSCLQIMPKIPRDQYDIIMTSPPYCNRYDYTRTYALELALLGITEKELVQLRQEMLSCTVENRPKDLLMINPDWQTALMMTDQQKLLQTILKYLDHQKEQGILNNQGIPRMVRGYFYEMACVIGECFRVLKPGGLLFMVNDNVRYAGVSISVDMILSDLAEKLGFIVENILVLPSDKGNSSQQMENHGRESLRKCVYIWKKL